MAIHFDRSTQTFYLEGKDVTYAFFINTLGFAEHLYYGRRIGRDVLLYTRMFGRCTTLATAPGADHLEQHSGSYQSFPAELIFGGTGDYREPTVLPCMAQGDRLAELLYVGHEILPEKPAIPGMPSLRGEETLLLHLADRINGFAADLYYTVYPDADVIARRVVYKNGGEETVRLTRAYSFNLALPGHDYDLITMHGGWADERHIERYPIHHGISGVDSKRTSSSAATNPFLAAVSHDATETSGDAYGVSLVYSSSFALKAQVAPNGDSLLTGGINDYDFCWQLLPGESFYTPEVMLAYSSEGIGGMSRALHDAIRGYLMNPRFATASRPLLLNNWEGTYFDFTVEKLKAMMDAALGTGIDTFVLDDGWFGKRNDDRSGLGDWTVNKAKLPGGLRELSDYAHEHGLKFGLWFEPEMVSEDSDLYRAHPDYAICAPDREPCHSRHQLMLDLTREDVRDYIVNAVNTIIRENGIDYVKWDYNRTVTESFSRGLPPERQQEFAHRYVLGVYELCERIVEANPTVFFEGCAAGGARFDPAMLHYFAQIWTSDNSDAEARTHIQYGTSLAYPLSAMSCHVSECPNHQTHRNTPFSTRANIAHLGATGYELDSTCFTEEERQLLREQTAEYRRCESLILTGDLYRLANPQEGDLFVEAVVSKDKRHAILVAYRRIAKANGEILRIRMQGLAPEKKYYVPELDLILEGRTLMNLPIPLSFKKEDFQTLKLHFEEK